MPNLAVGYIDAMKSVFPNFYVEIQNHLIPKCYDDSFPAYCEMIEREEVVRGAVDRPGEADTDTPLVLTNDSHMQSISDRRGSRRYEGVGLEIEGRFHRIERASLCVLHEGLSLLRELHAGDGEDRCTARCPGRASGR